MASRRSSQPKPKELARLYPNIVEIDVPSPNGFGNQLNLLTSWVLLRGCPYAHWGGTVPHSLREVAIWGFADDSDAVAFREFWATVQPMDQATAYVRAEQMSNLLFQQRAAITEEYIRLEEEERSLCNHYRNDIRKLGLGESIYGFTEFSEIKIRFDNLPVDVYPDGMGLVIRSQAGRPVFDSMRWGFPPPPGTGYRPITNVRNLKSGYWRDWLEPEWRCLVPFTAFGEWTQQKPKQEVWFEMAGSTAACFAGIWCTWTGTRGTKAAPQTGEHLLFSFLTTEANDVVKPIHPQAMPVILHSVEEQKAWLDGSAPLEALVRPLRNELLCVAEGTGPSGVQGELL